MRLFKKGNFVGYIGGMNIILLAPSWTKAQRAKEKHEHLQGHQSSLRV